MIKSYKIKNCVVLVTFVLITSLLVIAGWKGIQFGNVSILSLKQIAEKKEQVKVAETSLELESTKYSILENKLNSLKKEFEQEKAKYEAISPETVTMINELNAKDKYSIEYIWIKLGNYASANHLEIVVAEPGNSLNSEETKEDSIFTIQVEGSYTDVAEFIFHLESDSELSFKLDNIEMEYVSGTQIKATFDVKDIVILK